MIVRAATRRDLLGIGRVAEAAYWTSYGELLHPEIVGRLIARDFSPSALGRRLLRGGLQVATAGEEVVGFGHGVTEDDRLHVSALATDPAHRRRGIATALIAALREPAGALPAAADVLLGHLEAEQFLETTGFVPGEIHTTAWFEAAVIERRWWSEAVPELATGVGG